MGIARGLVLGCSLPALIGCYIGLPGGAEAAATATVIATITGAPLAVLIGPFLGGVVGAVACGLDRLTGYRRSTRCIGALAIVATTGPALLLLLAIARWQRAAPLSLAMVVAEVGLVGAVGLGLASLVCAPRPDRPVAARHVQSVRR